MSATSPPARAWFWPAAFSLVVAAVLLTPVGVRLATGAPLVLEDDAYYYAVIARHLAHEGVSTFDGVTLTNGYHPLWLLVVTAQTLLFGPAPLATLLLEAALMTAGLWVLARAARARSVAAMAILTALYAHYLGAMAMAGMEVSLLVFTAAVFMAVLPAPRHGSDLVAGLWLGMAAAACIGARIDAAVFVIPAVALAPRPIRQRAAALAALAVAGGAYVGVDATMFGAAMPISSAVKSLGGLQVNHRYLAQLAQEARHPLGHARHLLTLVVLAMVAPAAVLAPRGSRARALGAACAIGGALFFLKLAFLSSWRAWPWYDFPLMFAFGCAWFWLTPCADALAKSQAHGVAKFGLAAAAAVAALALGASILRAADAGLADGQTRSGGFAAINRLAVRRFAPILQGQRVAMGDRAGSFAMDYSGGVTQLEGLVNDAAWLRRLRQGGELTPDLCARRVAFLLAWRPDLGDYAQTTIPAMRPALTQFPSPVVIVRRAQQVGLVYDTSLYADPEDERPDRLYLWRLDCRLERAAPARVAPAPPRA